MKKRGKGGCQSFKDMLALYAVECIFTIESDNNFCLIVCLGVDKILKSVRNNFDEIKLHAPKDCEGLIVFEDNQACIQYSKNPVHHSTMKHLHRALKWNQQEHAKHTFKLIYVETINQLADIFTRALEAHTFWSLANRFMGYSP